MMRLDTRRWLIVLLLVPLVVSTACLTVGGGSPLPTERPAEQRVTPGAPDATEATDLTPGSPSATPGPEGPEATANSDDSSGPEEITVEGDFVLGPGPFDYPDPAAGLADLASYKASLSLSFSGTEAGQPVAWSKTYVLLSALDPAARQLTIEKTGQLDDLDPVFLAEVAGAAYEQLGAGACTAAVMEPVVGITGLMEPYGFLTGVLGADEAGSEAVNGQEARHYTFDQRALALEGIAEATGELWVAADGGYLVRYALVTQGGADYFGEGIEGALTWDYALTDVNQPVALALPADCPAGMLSAPQLPDAADVVNVPGVLSYVTAATPAEALAFYQQELTALGWQPTSEPVVNETLAVQDFTRGEQQLSITIIADETGTTVQLVLGVAG